MVYTRYRRRRRYVKRSFGRRTYKSRFQSKKRRIFKSKLVQVVKAAEMKRIEIARTFAPLFSTQTYTYASTVSQGMGVLDRIGARLTLAYFEMRAFIRQDSALASDSIRIVLFTVKGDTFVAAPASIFSGGAANVIATYDPDSKGQFQVLIDKTYSFSVTGNLTRHIHWKKKFKLDVKYQNTLDSSRQQELVLMLISNAGNLAISFDSRVKFFDS